MLKNRSSVGRPRKLQDFFKMMSFRKIITFRLFLFFPSFESLLYTQFLKLSTAAGADVRVKVSYFFKWKVRFTQLRQVEVFKVHHLPQN